jgi:hypothetical protein
MTNAYALLPTMPLVTVLTVFYGKIACMDTFMLNVPLVNDFFSTDTQ